MTEDQYEFEYRPMKRSKVDGAEWDTIHTYRSGGRPYRTTGGARGVLSREKREDALKVEQAQRMLTWDKIMRDDSRRPHWEQVVQGYEYKIQRRPFGEWEDVP